ncbi:MAG: prolyl oligopeptidase family serine peptidase [Gemmatimonadales bacterium]|nr:prolyl oligopeptidase family serine peptidase [Gemmatimonadales bacterium]
MQLTPLVGVAALALALACRPGEPTPVPVGFSVYEIPDATRQYQANGRQVPRPQRLWVWYPAASSSGASMRLGDYLSEPGSLEEPGSAAAVSEYRERFERGWDVTLEDADLAQLLDRPVSAGAARDPASGRHPAVLLEVGLNAPAYMYTGLAEDLAARGFVVASLASFGHGDGQRLQFDTAGIATQVADLEHALRSLQDLPYVDSDRLSIGGWSVGALSALLVASRNSERLRAFVSIDGAAGYEYGAELAQEFAFVAGCFTIPFLHLTGTMPGRFRVAKGREIYEALPGENAFWSTVSGLNHADFTSYGGIRSPLFAHRPLPEQEMVLEGSRQLERIVGAFLERYTGGQASEWNDLLLREPVEQLGEGDEETCR